MTTLISPSDKVDDKERYILGCFFTPLDISEALNMSRRAIYYWIHRGLIGKNTGIKLKTFKFFGCKDYFIEGEEIKNFLIGVGRKEEWDLAILPLYITDQRRLAG